MANSLVRDVVERDNAPSSSSSTQILSNIQDSSKTGFPTVQHRSKATSAFKRARLDRGVQTGLDISRQRILSPIDPRTDAENLRARDTKPKVAEDMEAISRSNTEAVERMTDDEVQREREGIYDRFGSGIDDLLMKVREARERRAARQDKTEGEDSAAHNSSTPVGGLPSPSPSTRATRKIRFVDPTEADVYVYESHPSSPKRALALLPPPPKDTLERIGIKSLGAFKEPPVPQGNSEQPSSVPSNHVGNVTEYPEEGTPEDIHRRFFPSEMPPENNPALTWMLLPTSPPKNIASGASDPSVEQSGETSLLEARFSLSGTRLSPSQISNLPTHLGLHHHSSTTLSPSSDTPAGYTLPDLLLLARSSVPAQRASILGVLSKVLKGLREEVHGQGHKSPQFLASPSEYIELDRIRRDVLDVAIDALGEKGGVGHRAVDILWEAVVGFTKVEFGIKDLNELPSIDLTPAPSICSSPTRPSSGLHSASGGSKLPPCPADFLVALPLARILPALKTHLLTSLSPFSLTHARVLDVLLTLSHFSQHARAIVDINAVSGMIAAMLGPHMQPSFDADAKETLGGTLTSIHILQALARSGRDVAVTLIGPADVLLRYIMTVPPPALEQGQFDGSFLSLELTRETLIFYTLLAEYGIYTHVATTAQGPLAELGAWLLTTLPLGVNPVVTSLTCAYLRLLEVLIICATDPHKTTPNHDILWSQVRGWDWVEWALELTDVAAASASPPNIQEQYGIQSLWTSICRMVVAWLDGVSVNSIKNGEEGKVLVLTRLGPLFQNGGVVESAVRAAVANLQDWQFPPSPQVLSVESLRIPSDAAGLLAAVIKLSLASVSEGKFLFDIPARESLHEVCLSLLEADATRELFDLISEFRGIPWVPEDAHTFIRPISELLFFELQLWHFSTVLAGNNHAMGVVALTRDWVTQALRILRVLLPGDEHHARWIFEVLCRNINSSFVQTVLPSKHFTAELSDKNGMDILLPFLTHSLRLTVVTSEDNRWRQPLYIAPISPTPESIANCTTLVLPSFSYLRYNWISYDQNVVLPLRNDWPIWPLNHLLRSGSSSVFCELPSNWDATETDVVRASLLLAQIAQELGSRRGSHLGTSYMSRAETVFTCMKVFMLEHGQQQLDSGEEVFRDSLVTHLMDELLVPFAYDNTRDASYQPTIDYGSSLEHISKAFLGTAIPFYQFYTDFLALYDGISFSHPLFGRLLLPPVSMAYPVDYRKLLFGDYGHVIRTLRADVGDLFCKDVREYLWPLEKDAHMIGWYLKALLTPSVHGFVRWMAVHHVALNIWLECKSQDTGGLERASKLLIAVVTQGSAEVVRNVALYRQPTDEVWTPPRCYDHDKGDWTTHRLDFAGLTGDQQIIEQLHKLFKSEM